VSEQTAGWMESQLACHRCGSMLAHKDARSIVLRTVFGKLDVPEVFKLVVASTHEIYAAFSSWLRGCETALILSSRSGLRWTT
jgi:hypothetical protein